MRIFRLPCYAYMLHVHSFFNGTVTATRLDEFTCWVLDIFVAHKRVGDFCAFVSLTIASLENQIGYSVMDLRTDQGGLMRLRSHCRGYT